MRESATETVFSAEFKWFNIDRKLLFCRFVLKLVLTNSVICWYEDLNVQKRNELDSTDGVAYFS